MYCFCAPTVGGFADKAGGPAVQSTRRAMCVRLQTSADQFLTLLMTSCNPCGVYTSHAVRAIGILRHRQNLNTCIQQQTLQCTASIRETKAFFVNTSTLSCLGFAELWPTSSEPPPRAICTWTLQDQRAPRELLQSEIHRHRKLWSVKKLFHEMDNDRPPSCTASSKVHLAIGPKTPSPHSCYITVQGLLSQAQVLASS